jgi:hypothetical protein
VHKKWNHNFFEIEKFITLLFQKEAKCRSMETEEDEENNIDIELFEIGYISRIIQMSCSFVS